MGISGKKKHQFRHEALFRSVYHVDPDSLPYETVVGLTENLERLLYRQALPVLFGVQAAQSNNDLPQAWFDALAEHETQIKRLEGESNIERAHRRALARRGPS